MASYVHLCSKNIFSAFTIRKNSCKGFLFFEPCSSCVDVTFVFSTKTMSGKDGPQKRIFFNYFLIFLSKCPNVNFWGDRQRRRDDDDDATNLRLLGPSAIAPRDRIPREGPPHLDNVHVKRRTPEAYIGISEHLAGRNNDEKITS